MTTGDPSVPTAAPAGRAPTSIKKPTTAAGEPVVTSTNGTSGMRRTLRTGMSRREADVLDRLSRLEEPVAEPAPVAEGGGIPTIVEADPTYPPAIRPTEQPTQRVDSSPPAPLPTMPVAPVPAGPADAETIAVATPGNLFAPGPIDAPPLTEIVPIVPVPSLDELLVPVDESTGVVLPTRPLQKPVTFKRAKPRVRRVTRVVRHVDTWSVFKVALVFNAILYLVCLTAGVLLWNVAYATGTIDNVEKFFEQFGWETFQFHGGELFHNLWIAGLFGAIGLTGLAVLLATLFNLITDLVGGVRVSVLEEEVLARAPSRASDRRSDADVAG